MPGIAELAMGAAPIAGGALFAAVAGNFKGPDYRATIKQDLELLEKIPADRTQLRAALQRSIDERIDDLIVSMDKGRQLRQSAAEYKGDWRDFVVFLCVVLFSLIWWNVDHDRGKWIVMMVFLVVLSVITGIYAIRGLLRSASGPLRRLRGSSG